MSSQQVPFLDLRVIDHKPYHDALTQVLSHGRIVLGPEVVELEMKLAKYVSRRYCVSVSSGSDALFLSLRSLGIGSGDEVITTPLSWIATANAIVMAGATPVFVDIDESLNIDTQTIENVITKNTKAILTVDYTGSLCDYQHLQTISDNYGLYLIEDGSQAFGAVNADGQKCGSFGHISAISHNPMKVFGGLGEIGSIFTDSEEIYNTLLMLRYAGTVNREVCHMHSLNHRPDTLNAAFLLHRLSRFETDVLAPRRGNACFYDKYISPLVHIPVPRHGPESHVYYTYTILASRRDELAEYLACKGIETKIQHKILMPEQPAFEKYRSSSYPRALLYCNRLLSLPIGEHLSPQDIEYVVDCISNFYT